MIEYIRFWSAGFIVFFVVMLLFLTTGAGIKWVSERIYWWKAELIEKRKRNKRGDA